MRSSGRYDIFGLEERRHYVRHSMMARDEGPHSEFKGHRMFHVDEINPKCKLDDGKVTRKSVSSSFCGMLNRGSGGTLYLGLLDDGKIEGFMMSADQMDHFRETVAVTLQSYTPPVPRHLFDVDFVPVIESFDQDVRVPTNGDDIDLPHRLLDRRFCWCDLAAQAQFERGIVQPFYVIEIAVAPWDAADSRNASLLKAHCGRQPIFSSEDGRTYMRMTASTFVMKEDEIAELREDRNRRAKAETARQRHLTYASGIQEEHGYVIY